MLPDTQSCLPVLSMGVQLFEGLGTRPATDELRHFHPGRDPNNPLFPNGPKQGLCGGSRSTRSQVREDANDGDQAVYDMPLGARVGTATLGVPGAIEFERDTKAAISFSGCSSRERIKK